MAKQMYRLEGVGWGWVTGAEHNSCRSGWMMYWMTNKGEKVINDVLPVTRPNKTCSVVTNEAVGDDAS